MVSKPIPILKSKIPIQRIRRSQKRGFCFGFEVDKFVVEDSAASHLRLGTIRQRWFHWSPKKMSNQKVEAKLTLQLVNRSSSLQLIVSASLAF
jgi:hypothetical protein